MDLETVLLLLKHKRDQKKREWKKMQAWMRRKGKHVPVMQLEFEAAIRQITTCIRVIEKHFKVIDKHTVREMSLFESKNKLAGRNRMTVSHGRE